MKTFIRLMVCLAIGLLLSIHDIAWPQEDCSKLFRVVRVVEDPDMNRVIQIWVTRWTQDNGSDGVCQWFGECVHELIVKQPAMAAVEILNPKDEWVPSIWRYIDITRARVLADLDEYTGAMWERMD